MFVLVLAIALAPTQRPVLTFDPGFNFGEQCRLEESQYKPFCAGYILARAEALDEERKVCLPSTVTGGQVQAVVRKYLNEHPELWDRAGWWLVRQALVSAFACP
jgi:hypothetical protein